MVDAVRLTGKQRRTFAVSASAAKSANPLAGGIYDVWGDVDIYITTGIPILETALTAANGYTIFAGNIIPVMVQQGEYLHAIAGGAGNIYYHHTGE